MISDVLFDALVDIDRYLANPSFDSCYAGKLQKRITKLRDDMVCMIRLLDTPINPPTKTQMLEDIAIWRKGNAKFAERIDDYMRFRATKEGVAYDLNASFYARRLNHSHDDELTFFGVRVDMTKYEIVGDQQQPELFEEWKSKQAAA